MKKPTLPTFVEEEAVEGKYRTLTFGDRTISFDAGLDRYDQESRQRPRRNPTENDTSDDQADDGIDPSLIGQLMNFDEEEEDEDEDDESEQSSDSVKSNKWQKTVAKDLLELSPRFLERRHSISLCMTPNRRKKLIFIHCFLRCNGGNLRTCELHLDEVAHIRSVLTKAELETLPMDNNIRSNVQRGKVCYVCLKNQIRSLLSRTKNVICVNKWSVLTATPRLGFQQIISNQRLNRLVPLLPILVKKYATLPKNNGRRISSVEARELERERLEGHLLNICTDCKDMVLQVIRASSNRHVKQESSYLFDKMYGAHWEYRDKRLDNWPLMFSIWPTLILCTLYLYFVYFWGKNFMKDKKSYEFKGLMNLYNLTQIYGSMYMFINFLKGGWLVDYNLLCQPVVYNSDPSSKAMLMNNQITFLHVFHHVSMPIYAWIEVRWLPVSLVETLLDTIANDSISGGSHQKLFSNICNVPSPTEIYPSQEYFTVYVEGPTGSGKSTFIEMFNERQDIHVVQEPVSSWMNVNGTDLFEMMYTDPKRWAGTFQLHASLTRIRSVVDPLPPKKKIRILERSIYSERYCFLEYLIKNQIMEKPETALMDKWFDFMVHKFEKKIKPDLIIYLRGDNEIFKNRILKRGRKEELPYIKGNIFNEIHLRHENWLFHRNSTFPVPAEVLILDANIDIDGFKEQAKFIENRFLPPYFDDEE
ncbi:dnk [Lepeophtheirus salmonis]|uniref:Dnk n=1 Tax=Lepeophtheirus salmonis TaxID=72036 RepID=A0A7R8D1V9_LEPSM|nr:dnk [Lepeophtheirus salmonis]CAF2998574.1 dnk [Lepeophtheirus salmonis]